jgi:hypothetical protein
LADTSLAEERDYGRADWGRPPGNRKFCDWFTLRARCIRRTFYQFC